MKMKWEEPMIQVQEFAANEYVAACGDTEYGVYKFECTAGDGYEGDVFVGGVNLTQNTPRERVYYHACSEKHESPTSDEYLDGVFYYNNGNDRTNGYRSIPVKVWTNGGTDIHCTPKLNQDSWEITKS